MATLTAIIRLEESLMATDKKVLTGINLQNSVLVLKETIGALVNLPSDQLELLFCGQVLQDQLTMTESGIEDKMSVQVLRAKNEGDDAIMVTDLKMPLASKIGQLSIDLKIALTSPSFATIIKKQECTRHVIQSYPELVMEPSLIALIRDVGMLTLLSVPQDLKTAIEKHLILAPALTCLIEYFKEAVTSNPPPHASHVSYSIDSLSDDDMDESGPSDTPGLITSAHLASALANAVASTGVNMPATRSDAPSTSSNSDAITSEMFNQAMRSALGAVAPPTLQSQLAQLRDMGITDEAASLRALDMTGGDVSAAIEYLFAQNNQRDGGNQS